FPTERNVFLEFFGSTLSDVFSFALAAKSVARFLSATGSAELIRSAASGPRIFFKVAISNTSAAGLRVSAGPFADLNSCCFFESDLAVVSDFFSEAACNGSPRDPAVTTAEAITKKFHLKSKPHFIFIGWSTRVHRRRPPPPPRAPPPRPCPPPKLPAPAPP